MSAELFVRGAKRFDTGEIVDLSIRNGVIAAIGELTPPQGIEAVSYTHLILYQDAAGRVRIALKFNEMVREGKIGPVMIGRDHHDVSGTDSPFRETANIKDGSNVTADMAAQCFAGNAARGMSLVALHNGGGVGISKAINGGFGLLLDGSERADETVKSALLWDVTCGVARRAWARNENSLSTGIEFNESHAGAAQITLPYLVDDELIDRIG